MAVTSETLKALHPEFGSIQETRVAAFITLAALRVASAQWGNKADLGVTWMACHMLAKAIAMESGKADLGFITSETVGELSKTYSNPQSNFYASYTDTDLGTTSYGRAFITLRRECFPERVL